MQLLNFKQKETVHVGLKTTHGILDLEEAGKQLDTAVPGSMEQWIAEGQMDVLSDIAAQAEESPERFSYLREENLVFAPVVTQPQKIVCVGLNYQDHVEETNGTVPEKPVLFSKFNNALAAHNESVPVPFAGEKVDYEAELVIVMGKEASNVSEEEAEATIFGYTIGNDLSIRDLQFKSGQWLLGKTADKFAPVGPYLTTADSVDPGNLAITMKRNGKLVQSSNTDQLIFDCAAIVSYISKHMTLKPGDLIFTGTPAGVIVGLPEEQRDWLKPGEELEVSIEQLGTLRNTFGNASTYHNSKNDMEL